MSLSIERRVQALEDEREILRTLYQYSHALDYEREEEFLDCFVPTGTWRVVSTRDWEGFQERHFAGHAELRRFFLEHVDAGSRSHKHLVAEPRIRMAGAEARVESYYVRIDEEGGGPYLFSMGRYRDVLVRCDDGRWRFVERHAEREAWESQRPSGAR